MTPIKISFLIFRHTRLNVTNLKLCRAENICWNMEKKQLEISNKLFSDSYIPSFNETYFVALSGQRENLAMAMFLKAFPSEGGDGDKKYRIGVVQASHPTLLMKRFLPTNTMHLLHDEILPGLATVLYHKRLREKVADRLVVALDDFGPTASDDMMTWLGQFWRLNNLQANLRMKNGLKPDEFLDYICFREAYIGLDSPSTSWYHYGFEEAQGPIEGVDKELIGNNLRSAADWIKDEILGKGEKLEAANVLEMFEDLKKQRRGRKQPIITIISRTQTRLILNEKELQQKIQKSFPMARVQFIRHETSGIEDLIAEVADSIVLIGMHGALMSLATFLPPESILIEMFPYGIPAEKYTPYKTLAELPTMKIRYASWVNPIKDEPFNVGHPEREYTQGGLKNFPASYQAGIRDSETVPEHKCCYSPFWLYKIFQDSHVQPESIIDLIKGLI